MKRSPLLPTSHIFVCANRRPDGDPLGAGCGDHGEKVYSALKSAVLAQRRTGSTWITKTACLGLCPKAGATVACYAPGQANAQIFIDVTSQDIDTLLDPRLPHSS